MIVILLLGLAAVVLIGNNRTRQRQADQEQSRLAGRRADVISLYDRLGHDVSTLDAGDDKIAVQSLADASERYTSAGGQLEQAKSDGEFAAAWRTSIEGLYYTRTVRARLGLELGPELPTIDGKRREELTGERELEVGDRKVRGRPDYSSDTPHYYGGGGGYAAGWYSFPFWGALLGGMFLGGAFGWGGFDSGYSDGYHDGQDAAGGDFGGDGGGDAGGGDAGGGDFGGGDFGGGDFGGI